MINTAHDRTINWLSEYIQNNQYASLEYKDIMYLLKEQKEFFIRCYLIDNKYLYGSIIKEVKDKILTC